MPAALLAALLLTAEAAPADRLAVIDRMPEFTLTDPDGRAVRSADLKGRVLLVGFVFTTCSGSCPATTARMAAVQGELRRRGLLDPARVRFVSITLDPKRDTPEAFARYARLYDLDRNTWSLLTGPEADVNRTVADWGMWAKPAPNGQLDHPSRIFLVDPAGRIREIYNLAFLKPAWAADDIAALMTPR